MFKNALSLILPATGVQYVIHRYKQVLSAYIKKKSMSEAFRHLGIDRNTIANTASIAELHLAGKDIVPVVGMFRQGEETLVNYAQRCTMIIDSDTELCRKIDQMKANGELLPISGKRPRGLHSHIQQMGGAAESILIGWWLCKCTEKKMIFIFKFIYNYLIIVFHASMHKMHIIYLIVIRNMDLLFAIMMMMMMITLLSP